MLLKTFTYLTYFCTSNTPSPSSIYMSRCTFPAGAPAFMAQILNGFRDADIYVAGTKFGGRGLEKKHATLGGGGGVSEL